MLFFKKQEKPQKENSVRACSKLLSREKEYGEMNKEFFFIVLDVFTFTNRSEIVVTGQPWKSHIFNGTRVEILSGQNRIPAKVGGLETFKKLNSVVAEGTNVGMLLEGVTKEQVKPGDIIVLPGCGSLDENGKWTVS